MMTQARMVPVGSNPKMFVRTDCVIGMEITRRYPADDEHILTIHMEGMPSASVSFDTQYEAAQAACALVNEINEAAS